VIRDGENGFYVEPENPLDLADKIIKMAADRKLREHMGENGRKFVEKHYNWEAISIKIIERYHLLLKQFDG
jgi:glycosyltransferase involved in cell wall biosynthesis